MSFRLMYRFWLDTDKPEQKELSEQLDELKAERKFSQTIRDGLRLAIALNKGDTSVLFELYPHLREQLTGSGNNADVAEALQMLASVIQSQQVGVGSASTSRPAAEDARMGLFDDVEIETVESEVNIEQGLNMLLNSFAD